MKVLIQATLPYNFVKSKNSEILSQAWREKKILYCSSLLVLFIANTINGALTVMVNQSRISLGAWECRLEMQILRPPPRSTTSETLGRRRSTLFFYKPPR